MLRCRRPPRRRQAAPPVSPALLMVLLSALLVGVACSFGEDGSHSPPDPIALEPATPAVIPRPAKDASAQTGTRPAVHGSAHPASLRTGIPAIDAVVRAVVTRDGHALAALFVLKVGNCLAPSDADSPAPCPDEREPGAPVGQFAVGHCESSLVRADDPERFASLLTRDSALYAAFGLVELQSGSGRSLSGYSVVFDRPEQPWVAHIAATGGIVSIDLGCSTGGAAVLVAGLSVEKVILPPPDGMPLPEDAG